MPVQKYQQDGWTVQKTGAIYEYQRKFTLSGSAETLDLNVTFPFELNRIEYFSDDTTAKSFSERIFSGGVDDTSYDQIVSVTLNTDQPLAYYPSGGEGIYTQSPILIRTNVTASTINKTLTKKVVIKRLA